jgi:hypothetical protein
MIYPTLYVTEPQFRSVPTPKASRRFVIIRDPRDTLVSGYFSLKISHPLLDGRIAYWRAVLSTLSLQDGLIYLMDQWLPRVIDTQRTWCVAGEHFVRYEDLIQRDTEILTDLLLRHCRLGVPRKRLEEAIFQNRFEQLTGGRPVGTEDVSAHERKGLVGDWKNYFTESVKRNFKVRYGDVLTMTGYERDPQW